MENCIEISIHQTNPGFNILPNPEYLWFQNFWEWCQFILPSCCRQPLISWQAHHISSLKEQATHYAERIQTT
jgi:hypothetical protein